MCGVFGFVSRGGAAVNVKTLQKIAKVTESRGRDAFGFAWIDGRGRLRCFKQTGRISCSLSLLAMAADAKMLIGHCRWATHGDCRNNSNNHPHPADGGWVVHNGTLPRYEDVIERYGLAPVTDCDSEVLGLLIEQLDGPLNKRCAEAVRIANPEGEGLFGESRPLVMLGLWKPGRLVVVRDGNPLHYSKVREGYYLGSLPDDLPGKAKAIKDKSLHSFTLKTQELQFQSLGK